MYPRYGQTQKPVSYTHLPIAPKMVAPFRIPPSLYQEMPNFGTLGGLILKLPDMLMCGSFRLGRLHEKLKQDLIRPIAPDTADLAASSFEENAERMLSRVESTVDFAACIFDAMVERTLSSLPPVSYTHLDVYKRQVPHHIKACQYQSDSLGTS